MPEIVQTQETGTQPQTESINLEDWKKKLSSAERTMKADFLPGYMLAKKRLRAEHSIKRAGNAKLTHEQVSLVYSIGTNYINSVYFKSPECNLIAREEVQHDTVENTEVMINDWLQDKKVKKVIKRCLWDAYLGGFGARFIDYDYQDQETQTIVGYEPGDGLVPPEGTQPGPTVADDLGQKPIYQRVVLQNEIVIKRLRPDLLRFPKGFDFDDYQDSPWIGFDCIETKDDILNDNSFDPNQRQLIEFEKYESLSRSEEGKAIAKQDDTLYGKLHYVFVRPSTKLESFKLLVFAKGCTAPLKYLDYEKGVVGYPVKFIYHNPLDDDCSYPKGDPWMFESQLNAVDKWWRTYARHVERAAPQTIYNKSIIDQKEIQAIKSSDDLLYVGVKVKDGAPIQNAFYERQKPAVNQDVTIFYQTARQLLSEISPKSGLTRGATDNAPGTATEAKIMATGETIDLEARVDDIADFIKDIVLDVAGILANSLNGEMTINREAKNQVGQPVNVPMKVTREHFTDKINVDVEVESMQAQNKDVIRRQLLDTLGTFTKLQPLFQMSGETIKPKFWIQKLMDVSNIKNIEDGFMPLPPMPVAPQATPSGETTPGPVAEGEGMPMPPEAIEAGLAQRT